MARGEGTGAVKPVTSPGSGCDFAGLARKSMRPMEAERVALVEAEGTWDRQRLSRALAVVESHTRHDVMYAHRWGLELRRWAEQLSDEQSRLRAELVLADVQIRRGQSTAGMLTAQDVREWATKQADDYLVARAARVVAQWAWRFGDHPLALENALEALSVLPEDADPFVQMEHRLSVGDALTSTGSYESAEHEYKEVIADSRPLGCTQAMLAAINNLAFLNFQRGDTAEALQLASQVVELCEQHDAGMQVTWVDTVARILMATGCYRQVYDSLSGALSRLTVVTVEDRLGLAECYLCHGQVARLLGEIPAAQGALDRCEQLIETYQIDTLRKDWLREKASLAAQLADFENAYHLERQAFDLAMDAKTDERDAQVRSLKVLHESNLAEADRARFRRLSLLDSLTGLGNRRYLSEVFAQKRMWVRQQQETLALGIFDLDHFKRINDTWNHDTGDRVLQEVAALIAGRVGMGVEWAGPVADQETPWLIDIERSMHVCAEPCVARFGGEEFVLLLPQVSSEQALVTMESVLQGVRANKWPGDIGIHGVTGSMGLVVTDGSVELTELLRHADDLLYQAKSNGRDRVVGPLGLTS